MSTPAKRHCQSPAGSLESSFQKRLRKVSIEGNIGELGGAGKLRAVGESEEGWEGARPGAPQGAGMLGETEREAAVALIKPALRAAGCSAGKAAPGPEPGARLGRMGSPAGRVPIYHTEAQGGLGSTNSRCPLARPGLQRPLALARPRQVPAPARPRPRSPPSSARRGSS